MGVSYQTPDGTAGDDEQAVVDPFPDDDRTDYFYESPSPSPSTPIVRFFSNASRRFAAVDGH